jgi:hypothetical protein
MSMHIHLEHDNLSPKEMQRYIAIGTFGSANVKKWVQVLDQERNPDEHPEIPSAVKKYWKILRHEETLSSKKQKELELQKELAKKEKETSQKDEPKSIVELKVGAIKSKLRDMPKDAVLVVWIKDLNSWRFIKDAFRRNPDILSHGEDDQKDIDLKLTKSVDIEKEDNNDTIVDPKDKVLHVNELLTFLDWDRISDDETIYIISKKEGGAKLTKIEKQLNVFGSESVLMTFEYDKRYYRGFVRDYLRQRKLKKK